MYMYQDNQHTQAIQGIIGKLFDGMFKGGRLLIKLIQKRIRKLRASPHWLDPQHNLAFVNDSTH